jgi:monoamine oxidase
MARTDPAQRADRHDVLILGGGAAGLSAATALVAEGVDVAILEARARLGGRIWTVHETGRELTELGAEFVHGDAPRTAAIAHDARVELREMPPSKLWHREGALVEAPDLERSLDEAMDAAARGVRHGDDRSFAAALAASGVDDPGRALALEYVQNFQGADAERISERALGTGDLGSGRTRRLPGGYDGIVDALAERLPSQTAILGCVAKSVRWSHRSVAVVSESCPGASDRVFRASRLIAALPLGVLPGIEFDPALEEFESKVSALRGLTMGHAVRLVLRFRDAFWRGQAPTPSLIRLPGAAWPAVWTGVLPDSKSLVTWAGGPAAQALEGLKNGELAERALEALSAAFAIPRGELDALLVGARSHDWTRDPFARGAYSYPLVGGAHGGRALAEPLDETLFFAGEATIDPPANGTVEGALESGFRAARAVLHAMSC